MYVDGYPSEGGERAGDEARIGDIRVRGGLSIHIAAADGVSRITDLEERGGYRAKFPARGACVDAVSINTGGGLVGGDHVSFALTVGENAAMSFVTQSAERVYRALTDAVRTTVKLSVGSKASLDWLPQETILFDGAKLSRTIEADVASDASLLLCEAVVFGREAMGENITTGSFRDRWTIRRDGDPVYAEAIAIEGGIHEKLQSRAVAAAARAAATVVLLSPDAEDRRDAAREALGEPIGRTALSAWNGMLVARCLAPNAAILRKDLARLLTHLTRKPMPRVWNC